MRPLLLFLLTAFSLTACKGADGPMGPAGPAGPAGAQGLPGPAGPQGQTRLVLTAIVGSSGGAAVALPAAAGTNLNLPPSMACYIGQVGSNVWLAVSDGDDTSASNFCGLVFGGGVFNAVMSGAPVGWIAAFVIVY